MWPQARFKISGESGSSAYAGCGGCLFTGSLHGRTVYYKGYDKPAPQYRWVE